MFKLFAIFTALTALPVSALAEQVPLTKSAGIHCAKDSADQPYVAPISNEAPMVQTDQAHIAR